MIRIAGALPIARRQLTDALERSGIALEAALRALTLSVVQRGRQLPEQVQASLAIAFEDAGIRVRPERLGLKQKVHHDVTAPSSLGLQGVSQRLLPAPTLDQPEVCSGLELPGTAGDQRLLLARQPAQPAPELAFQLLTARGHRIRDLRPLFGQFCIAHFQFREKRLALRSVQALQQHRELRCELSTDLLQVSGALLQIPFPAGTVQVAELGAKLAQKPGVVVTAGHALPGQRITHGVSQQGPLPRIKIDVARHLAHHISLGVVIGQPRNTPGKQRNREEWHDSAQDSAHHRLMIAVCVRSWAARSAWMAAGLLAGALTAPPATAQDLSLRIETLGGEGFRLYDIAASLDVSGAGELAIGQAELPEPFGRVDQLELRCATLRLSSRALRCQAGRLQFSVPGLPPLAAQVSLTADSAGRVALRLEELAVAGGRVTLDLQRSAAGELAAAFHIEGATPEALAALWPSALTAGLTGAGTGSLSGQIRITPEGQILANGDLTVAALTVATADGAVATENLAVGLRWGLHGWRDRALELVLEVAETSGLAYLDPVFLDLDEAALAGEVRMLLDGAVPRLHALRLRDGEALRLEAVGSLTRDGRGWLAINRLELALPGGYERYLQPFLVGGPLDQLDGHGRLHGQGLVRDGRWTRLALDIEDLSFTTRDRQLGLDGLAGALHWQQDEDARPSWLAWQRGALFDIGIGPARLDLRFIGDGLRAPGVTRIPILDGALVITNLDARGLATGNPEFGFDARLEPLSLERLTEALGWPALGGEIAGQLPGARYRNRVIETEGTLDVEVFDGRISIEALRIEGLLSPLPRAAADVRIHQLDLEQLTGTFAFGQITGRLEGEILGLRLLEWRPSAFDAWLATSAGYRGPRRISQRAIDNLTAIGGGGVGGFPGGLMRIFDEFGYERIGLSCNLRNEVCLMDGVATANGAYYIVRGRGLPRIDVLGTARRVSWPVLLAQLAALEAPEAPAAP